MKKSDPSRDSARALTEIQVSVLFHVRSTPRLQFSVPRWPYTYAADFVRAHEAIIPAHIWDHIEVSGGVTRAQAARARTVWANSLKLNDYELACQLACGYIIENGVDIFCSDARRLVPTWVWAYVTPQPETTS